MGKVTFKIPKKAFENAGDQGDFEQAPPGLYVAKLTSCEQHYAKGKDSKPDKTKPSLECIYQITAVRQKDGSEEKPDVRYSQIWDYVSMRDSEDVQWKQAQFAAAMGLGDGSKNVNTSKDPKEFVNTTVLLRVKKDTDQNGDYRAKVGWVGPYGEGGADEDAFDDEAGDEAFGEEGDDADGDDSLYTEDDLKAMVKEDRDGFKELCEQYEIKVKGKKPSELITAILEAQQEAIDAEAEGEGDDDDEPF